MGDRLHEDLADAVYADQNRRVLQDFDRVTEAYRIVETLLLPLEMQEPTMIEDLCVTDCN